MATLSNEHVNVIITSLLPAYTNEEYIGDAVAPVLPVNKLSDKYFLFNRDTFIKGSGIGSNGLPNSSRLPRQDSQEIFWDVAQGSFEIIPLAAKIWVSNQEIKLADDPLNPSITAATVVRNRLLLDNEAAVASVALDQTKYSNPIQLVDDANVGTSWKNYESASSNPFRDIKRAKRAVKEGIFREANTLLISYGLSYTLQDHPWFRDTYKYQATEGATKDGLPANFRGLSTQIAGTFTAMSGYGASTVAGNIWQSQPLNGESENREFALVYYRDKSNQYYAPQTFRTFEAPNPWDDTRGFSVRTWYDISKDSHAIEVGVSRTWKAIATDSSGNIAGAQIITDVPDRKSVV